MGNRDATRNEPVDGPWTGGHWAGGRGIRETHGMALIDLDRVDHGALTLHTQKRGAHGQKCPTDQGSRWAAHCCRLVSLMRRGLKTFGRGEHSESVACRVITAMPTNTEQYHILSQRRNRQPAPATRYRFGPALQRVCLKFRMRRIAATTEGAAAPPMLDYAFGVGQSAGRNLLRWALVASAAYVSRPPPPGSRDGGGVLAILFGVPCGKVCTVPVRALARRPVTSLHGLLIVPSEQCPSFSHNSRLREPRRCKPRGA